MIIVVATFSQMMKRNKLTTINIYINSYKEMNVDS